MPAPSFIWVDGVTDYIMHSAKYLMLAAVLTALVFVTVFDSSDSDAADEDVSSYYYDQIDPVAQVLYDAALAMEYGQNETVSVFKFSEYPQIDHSSSDALTASMQPFLKQLVETLGHESLWTYWFDADVNAGYKWDDTQLTVTATYRLNNYYPDNSVAILQGKISEIEPDLSSRYMTVLFIHNYLCNTLSYYPDHPIPDTTDIRSLYTAIAGDHIVVCEGYAKAFKALCDVYNIPCLLVTGQGISEEGGKPTSESHMWNMVQMDNGQWYIVDCTWDDQSTLHLDYFLAGTDSPGFNYKVGEEHVVDEFYTIPTASKESYDKNTEGGAIGEVSWIYDKVSKSLSVFGEGAMDDLADGAYGWDGFKAEVLNLSISQGVTYIGTYAFKGMTALESVSVASTVATPFATEAFGSTVFYDESGKNTVADSLVAGNQFYLSDSKLVMYAKTYVATFKAEGVTVAEVPFTMLSELPLEGTPKVPAKVGYDGAWPAITLMRQNIEVVAVYTIQVYTINFYDENDNLLSTADLEYKTVITAPADPVKASTSTYEYVFKQWNDSGRGIVFATGNVATSDADFRPEFTANFIDIQGTTDKTASVDSDDVSFSKTTLDNIKSSASSDASVTFTVKLNGGSIKFDNTALRGMTTGDVDVSILKSTDSKFKGPVYSINFGSGIKTNGTITLTLPFDTSGKDAADYRAYYIYNGKLSEEYPVLFDGGNVSFDVNHLSSYVIQEKTDSEDPAKDAIEDLLENPMMLIIIVIVIAAIIGVVAVRHHRA